MTIQMEDLFVLDQTTPTSSTLGRGLFGELNTLALALPDAAWRLSSHMTTIGSIPLCSSAMYTKMYVSALCNNCVYDDNFLHYRLSTLWR